jgi:hypothetical protein
LPREINKQISLSPPHKQKTVKGQQGTPKAKPQQKAAQARRNKTINNKTRARHTHTRTTKTYESQTKSYASPTPNKNFDRASSTPCFPCHRTESNLPFPPPKQKTVKAQREPPEAQVPFLWQHGWGLQLSPTQKEAPLTSRKNGHVSPRGRKKIVVTSHRLPRARRNPVAPAPRKIQLTDSSVDLIDRRQSSSTVMNMAAVAPRQELRRWRSVHARAV